MEAAPEPPTIASKPFAGRSARNLPVGESRMRLLFGCLAIAVALLMLGFGILEYMLGYGFSTLRLATAALMAIIGGVGIHQGAVFGPRAGPAFTIDAKGVETVAGEVRSTYPWTWFEAAEVKPDHLRLRFNFARAGAQGANVRKLRAMKRISLVQVSDATALAAYCDEQIRSAASRPAING